MAIAFKTHHIAVLTNDATAAAKTYALLGFRASSPVLDPGQGVHVVLLTKGAEPMIELVQPAAGDSLVANLLAKRGAGPYHTCYEVPAIAVAVEGLRSERFVQVSEVIPAVAFAGRKICFLFHPAVGLIELLEEDPS